MYDLIIIGGGPAGITAGIYAARKKIKTLLITKKWGGQITSSNEVQNWPGIKLISGLELINKMKEHLLGYQIETKEDREIIDLTKTESDFLVKDDKQGQYHARAVLVATGKMPRMLNIPGEKEFKGKGVSICSTCDAPIFKDKEVAVIGGGNTGFNAAYDLTKYAKQIYILEFMEQMQGDALIKEKLEATGKVKFLTNVAVKEIKGDKFVNGLVYEEREQGREENLPVSGVFLAIGMKPKAAFAEDLVDFDDKTGEIVVNQTNNTTKTSGLFAAGDVTNIKFDQIVIACGDGAKAVLAIDDYLNQKK